MNNENANLPAYPFKKEGKDYMHEGLTKRELIAAMCLQGFISKGNADFTGEYIVNLSIIHADELLNQLSKP